MLIDLIRELDSRDESKNYIFKKFSIYNYFPTIYYQLKMIIYNPKIFIFRRKY